MTNPNLIGMFIVFVSESTLLASLLRPWEVGNRDDEETVGGQLLANAGSKAHNVGSGIKTPVHRAGCIVLIMKGHIPVTVICNTSQRVVPGQESRKESKVAASFDA